MGIYPWVRVQCLASKVLGLSLRQLAADWQRVHGVVPVLVETYVSDQHKGTCYRASNWHYLGQDPGARCLGHGAREDAQGCLRVSAAAGLADGPARTKTPCALPLDARLLGHPLHRLSQPLAPPLLNGYAVGASPVWSGQHHFDGTLSGNELVYDIAVDVGQAEVAAIVAEREPLVIQAQQVEDGGMEVVMRDAVLNGVHAELVGCAVGNAWLDVAARHPHGEAEVVMAAAEGFLFTRLLHWRAAELCSPDDERLVQQTS